MQSSFMTLPQPDVIELHDVPFEFNGLLRPFSNVAEERLRAAARDAGEPRDPLLVQHIDEPRASIYALFS